MNTLTFPIMNLDEPNRNHRVYPSHEMIKAIEISKPVLGTIEMPPFDLNGVNIEIKDASHIASNFRIKDGQVFADINVLNTESGKKLQEMIDAGDVAFRTAGFGKCEDNIISDYRLVSVAAIHKDKAA